MEENFELLEGYQFNLSDFALFLSVMKDPRAYRCVLSVFMDEPDIELQDVKVEQVVLNKSGKRAIRLDAWGSPWIIVSSTWKCKTMSDRMICGSVRVFTRECWTRRS